MDSFLLKLILNYFTEQVIITFQYKNSMKFVIMKPILLLSVKLKVTKLSEDILLWIGLKIMPKIKPTSKQTKIMKLFSFQSLKIKSILWLKSKKTKQYVVFVTGDRLLEADMICRLETKLINHVIQSVTFHEASYAIKN